MSPTMGERKTRIGEIVVASYSFDAKHWQSTLDNRKKSYLNTSELFKHGIGYFYTILPPEIASKHNNLPYLALFFTKTILEYFQGTPKVQLGLDGKLTKPDQKKLYSSFSSAQIPFHVKAFPKKRNHVHYGPELIRISHTIANRLLKRSRLETAEDKHYVLTPLKVLEDLFDLS
jgi:hypothetical protein